MAPGAAGTTINRVRLLRAGPDPLAARLGAARLLAQVAPASALAPAAILCVKRLRDPRPGSLRLSSAHQPPHQWTRAVDDALSGLARAAARPARGAFAGDPDAVLFDDRAQMLACLAADWCSGTVARRWWWRALVGEVSNIEAVVRAWRERPEHIAAAVEELAALGAAAQFVRRLSREHVRLLLDAVVVTHGLAELATAIGTALPADGDAWELPRASIPGVARVVFDERASDAGVPHAPWTALAPEAGESTLRADQKLLLGVALAVRRRAAVARSAAFATATLAWRAARLRAAVRLLDDVPVAGLYQPEHTSSASDVSPTRAPSVQNTLTREAPESRPARFISRTGAAPDVTAATDAHVCLSRTPLALDGTRPAPVVHTGLGGLFYLLNAAMVLGFYGDFTAPSHRSLDLSIWDFVALVGQALVPDEGEDPIWELLAVLAGRDLDDTPGANVDPPDGWTSWTEWLMPHVRARLSGALGNQETAVMGRVVCCHQARVLVTSTHLDVQFSLADLPIAVRMSGLDRDPGWIPAADRIVTFHFD